MKAKYITFSSAVTDVMPVTPENVLRLGNFPADAKVLKFQKFERTDTDPPTLLRCLAVIGSDTYEDVPEDELFISPGMSITQHVFGLTDANGYTVQIATCRPVGEEIIDGLRSAGFVGVWSTLNIT